jgi:hypothetical protein
VATLVHLIDTGCHPEFTTILVRIR